MYIQEHNGIKENKDNNYNELKLTNMLKFIQILDTEHKYLFVT